jgi:hypothetical protein
MASNIKARPQEDEVPEKQAPETAPDRPLLDLSDAAVKKLIRSAKKRGYVTHDQINSVLPRRSIPSRSRTCSPCSARWVQGSVAFRLAKGLGMKTGQQRHRDKDKCRHRYGKIGRFCCYITKSIAHSHSPTIAA